MPPYLQRMPFPPWVPDRADQETQVSANVSNVLPRSDGWLPFMSFRQFTQALPAPCRGFFFARNADGTVSLFAGTAVSRLYKLDNTTFSWNEVSQVSITLGTVTGGAGYTNGTYTAVPATGGSGTGMLLDITIAGGAVTSAVVHAGAPGTNYIVGDVISASAGLGAGAGFHVSITAITVPSYGSLASDANWQFEQYNQIVIAVQGNVNPQKFFLQTGGNFYDLGGNPPRAGFIAIVNRFVVLSGLTNGTFGVANAIPNFPYSIAWSDLSQPEVYGATAGQSDFQELPDGGRPKAVAGFDLYGVIFQDNMARLLSYAPGSPVVFTITKITGGDGNGLYANYGWVIDQDNLFWLSQEGFKQMAPGNAPTPVGKEMVDRYIFANLDTSNTQLIIATTDPVASRMYFAFKSLAGLAGLFDTILIYDWLLKRWSKVNFSGEWLDVLSRPGKTLELMDVTTSIGVTPSAAAVPSITNITSGGGGVITLTLSSTAGLSTATQQTLYGKWNITRVPLNAGGVPPATYGANGVLLAALYNMPAPQGAPGEWMTNTIGALVPGSGYTANTYTNVATTGGAGSGMTLNVTVAGGVVTVATINNPGNGLYLVGDVLTVSNTLIGGTGSGFSVTVQPGAIWGQWAITNITGNTVDLVGSVFPAGGVYTAFAGSSGGVFGANIDGVPPATNPFLPQPPGLIPFSFDTVSSATLPSLGAIDSNNTLGFFNGTPLEAIIETGEEGGNDRRLFVKGFRVITDATRVLSDNAPSVFGSVSYRDNPQSAYNYTSEVAIDVTGTCLVAGGGIDTRYSRARIRIPAGTTWNYALGVEPDGTLTGSY